MGNSIITKTILRLLNIKWNEYHKMQTMISDTD